MIVRSEVFERDRWACQMPVCLHPEEEGGRAIDPALARSSSPWAPSLDHIIQRQWGGKYRLDNLRAAHQKCNANDARRYARGPWGRRKRARRPEYGDEMSPAAVLGAYDRLRQAERDRRAGEGLTPNLPAGTPARPARAA